MSLQDTKTVAWRVVGRVQGVGFRYWTRQHAQRLELAGTVRNAADGSVIVAAEGRSPRLEQLQKLLAKGPPGSRVDSLEAIPSPADALPFPFEIQR